MQLVLRVEDKLVSRRKKNRERFQDGKRDRIRERKDRERVQRKQKKGITNGGHLSHLLV